MSDEEESPYHSEEEEDQYISDDDFEEEEAKPKKATKSKEKADSPAKPKAKTAAKPKATKSKEKTDSPAKPKAKKASTKSTENKWDDIDDGEDAPKTSRKKKTVEEEYVKLDQIEHALQRPDMYIGAAKPITQAMWIYEKGTGMVYKKITYTPGLYKIFDEILVNAADNKQRDASMTYIKVEIDKENGQISVENDGDGIPVVMHEKEKMYVPELIFGHLLTGSNFDDTVKKVTGGRNGLGAKLANIFSSEFTVETVDSERGKKFVQVFRDNLSVREKPEITTNKRLNSYTKITFKPDLSRFGMTHLDEDTLGLLTKRVYDIAGTNPGLRVSLNGEKITMKSFMSYCDLYLKDPSKPRLTEKPNDRWEICVSLSDGEFQQVSFVNSICTTRGGTHVLHIQKKIVKAIMEAVEKKNKAAPIKPAHVKNHLWIFVNSLIENPAFDSQTKETLMTATKDFGSKCDLSEGFLKKVLKCGVVESILNFAKAQQDVILKKTSGGKRKTRLSGIDKLDDANDAGSKHSQQCTLILTEGDSAKTLAVSGLSIVGRDKYGVFPLKGKLLNVREASHKQLMDNAEINALKQILGLKHGENYKNASDLRYGHVMIMTDQDQDGSHIKGLIINFVHKFWPSLLQVPGFLREFITPIVKAKKDRETVTFFTLPEYKEWKKQVDAAGERGWTIKYYKGLGTSTPDEAKEYFAALDDHQIDFRWDGEDDGELIDMAFSKKRAEDRKEWMRKFEPGTFLDHDTDAITYTEFINKELILFSLSDCERSIPSLVDGLKPGQRKILYVCLKFNIKKDIKVAQLGGRVAEKSAYHHGEASLQTTIVAMAQNFVGSNNINLLFPSGQFGSRIQGGKDAASARYIFTRLNKITRYIFRKEDDDILSYLDDDGYPVEPKWYIPILPMVLVNGAEGIGTGWSTYIPNYNPKDISKNLRHMIKGEELEPMIPWYRGFKGAIVADKADNSHFKVSGIWKKLDNNRIEITELPLGTWTQSYKEFLEKLINDEKKGGVLKDYREYHTDTSVHFELEFADGKLEELEKGNKLEKELKLTGSIATTNMHAFDSEGRITMYGSPEAILKAFYDLRLEYYQKRKDYLLEQLREQWLMLDNKVRFILAVVKEEIIIRNRKRADLLKELADKKFTPFDNAKTKKKAAADEEDEDEEASDTDSPVVKKEIHTKTGYDYLLKMPLWSLTLERVQELLKQREAKEKDVNALADTPTTSLWLKDLEEFEEALDEWILEEERRAAATSGLKRVKGAKRRRSNAKPQKRKKAVSDDDDDFETKPAPKKAIAASSTTSAAPKKVVVPKEEKPTSTTAAKSTTAAAKKPAEATKKIDSFFKKESKKEKDPFDMDSDEDLPLSERLARKNAGHRDSIETIAAKPAAKPAAKKPVPDPMEVSSDDEPIKKPPPKEAKKETTKPAAKPAPKKKDDSFDLDLSDDDSPVKPKKPAAKAAPAKKETTKPAAKPAPKKKDADSEDDDEPPKKAASKPAPKETAEPSKRGGRAKAPVKYYASEDEEDDDDESDGAVVEDDSDE